MNRIALAVVSLLAVGAPAAADEPTSVVATTYYRTFSHAHPVLKRIKPGEAVATKTLDSAGLDEKDVKRSEPFNPLTGPFFVEGAEPGDALVVRLEEGAAESRLGLVRLPARPLLADARDGRAHLPERHPPRPRHQGAHDDRALGHRPQGEHRPAPDAEEPGPSAGVPRQADARLHRRGAGGRFCADLGAVGALRRQPRLQQDRRGGDRVPAGLSPRRAAVRRRRPRPPGRRRADGDRDRDVDGRGVRRRAEEGGEADRAAGRDGRRDHQHRLAARVRQRPRQRPQDGHERHGRLARQGLRDGALGRAPVDRLPGALRRRHRRRVDGPLPAEEPAAEAGRRARHQVRGDGETARRPRPDRLEDERAPQDRRVHPALLGRAAGEALDGGLAVRQGIPVSDRAGERAGVEPGRARPRAARRLAGGDVPPGRAEGPAGRAELQVPGGHRPGGGTAGGRRVVRAVGALGVQGRGGGGGQGARRRDRLLPPRRARRGRASAGRRSRGRTGSTTPAAPWRPGGPRGSRRTRRSRRS